MRRISITFLLFLFASIVVYTLAVDKVVYKDEFAARVDAGIGGEMPAPSESEYCSGKWSTGLCKQCMDHGAKIKARGYLFAAEKECKVEADGSKSCTITCTWIQTPQLFKYR